MASVVCSSTVIGINSLSVPRAFVLLELSCNEKGFVVVLLGFVGVVGQYPGSAVLSVWKRVIRGRTT